MAYQSGAAAIAVKLVDFYLVLHPWSLKALPLFARNRLLHEQEP
jgi:hypothetical protein